MNLTYRGILYQPQHRAIAAKKTTIFNRFRGSTYQLSRSIELANNYPCSLKYRGVTYQKFLKDSPASDRQLLSPPVLAIGAD